MKLSNFLIINSIAQYGFGQVVLAKCKENDLYGIDNNQLVAIQIIKKVHIISIMKEIEMFDKVKNAMFLSQMYGAFQDRTDAFLVLRYQENGSLLSLINHMTKLTTDFAQQVIVEVSLGLKFLHEQNNIHGDLKPENILLDRNLRAHVADCGISLKYDNRKFYEEWGTAIYQNPDQILGTVAWDHRVHYFNTGIIFINNAHTDRHIKNIVKLKFDMPQIDSLAVSFVQKAVGQRRGKKNG